MSRKKKCFVQSTVTEIIKKCGFLLYLHPHSLISVAVLQYLQNCCRRLKPTELTIITVQTCYWLPDIHNCICGLITHTAHPPFWIFKFYADSVIFLTIRHFKSDTLHPLTNYFWRQKPSISHNFLNIYTVQYIIIQPISSFPTINEKLYLLFKTVMIIVLTSNNFR